MRSLYNIGDVDLTATAELSERIGTMIYVISKDGNPLMPTKRHGKVKYMLRSGKAKVVKRTPVSGKEYQEDEQPDFWNVREYVLFRDGHQCQHCKGKSKDKILNVHHIESRKTGGNAQNNLITLCETCHAKYHDGEI